MKFLRILFFVFSLTTTLVVSAYDFEANGLYFDIVSPADLTCALTDGPSGHKYTGALVIPDEVEYSGKKLKVVSIACKLPEVSSVKFGKNITETSDNCLKDNKLITSITLPSSLTKIGSHAFEMCTSLTSVKWEGDMILSEFIFYNCENLKNLYYKSICKDIPEGAFSDCSSLQIDLSKVESIGAFAFSGCKSLKVLDLSSIQRFNLQSFTYRTSSFSDCGNISLLIIGPNISSIPCASYDGVFDNCIIDSLAILPSETDLIINLQLSNKTAFFDKTTIKSLYLGRNTYTEPTSHYFNGKNHYYRQPFYGSEIALVRVGGNVTKLPTSYHITIAGQNLGYFGYFEDCKNLSKITFEGADITIGSRCFLGTNLRNINLTTGTNKLYSSCFPSEIETISFGSDVCLNNRHIYDYDYDRSTFNNIKNSSTLKQISFLSIEPPQIDSSFGTQVYISTKLLVPYGSKKAYQNAEPWKNFLNIEEMPGVNTEKIEIKSVNTNLHVGDSIKLTGIRYPEYATDTLQWKSSDVKIATISHDGLVKAVAPGKTTITVISGKATATCEVTVTPVTATRITLSQNKVSINESDTIKIAATVSPENTTDKTIQWSSSDEKIATVSKEGIIKAIKVGTAKITAACGDVSATCEVTVLPITAEKITLNKDSISINISDSIKITATIIPETTTDKTVKWTSSNEKVATVSTDGVIKAIKVGTAKITATCGKVSATCEVTILPINAEKIVLSKDSVSISVSDTLKITATVTPETTTDKTIKWSSSDEKIATVSKEGIVTAIGAGTATITATCGEISSSCEVTVYEPNIAIEVTDNTLSVIVEGSSDPVNISLFTVFGQCAYRQSVDASIVIKEKIDLSKLPSGTYIVQVISGTMNSSKRIVKS